MFCLSVIDWVHILSIVAITRNLRALTFVYMPRYVEDPKIIINITHIDAKHPLLSSKLQNFAYVNKQVYIPYRSFFEKILDDLCNRHPCPWHEISPVVVHKYDEVQSLLYRITHITSITLFFN